MKRRLIAALAALALSASAWGQGSFYEGKTVTLVIGASGGSLEIAARIVARHLGKHLPGNPTVIVQNMTGAAHLVATNHVYNVAKPDGLTLLAANPSVGIAQLTKVEAVRFDLRRFHWLGSSGADGVALSVRADLPFWMPWEFSWPVYLACVLTLFWFGRGLALLPPQERPAWWRQALFVAGVASFWIVLQTRIDYYAQHMFFVHRWAHFVLHHAGISALCESLA